MIKFNVASINTCTETEGPYKRLCIWFQGCNIGCKGCCNPDYQPLSPRHIMSLDVLVSLIERAKNEYGIEGVTYLGGEPTLQQNLPSLTNKIKELGLGVISFTGRIYEDVAHILQGCDAVLDGAYRSDLSEQRRRLIGSTNQRILCLTDRYADCIEDWFSVKEKGMEINVGTSIVINGDKF